MARVAAKTASSRRATAYKKGGRAEAKQRALSRMDARMLARELQQADAETRALVLDRLHKRAQASPGMRRYVAEVDRALAEHLGNKEFRRKVELFAAARGKG